MFDLDVSFPFIRLCQSDAGSSVMSLDSFRMELGELNSFEHDRYQKARSGMLPRKRRWG
jgi:hypothetical protein